MPDDARPPENEPKDLDDQLIDILSSQPTLPAPPHRRRPQFRRMATVCEVHNQDDGTLRFDIRGGARYTGEPVSGWNVDFGALNAQMSDLGQHIARYHDAGQHELQPAIQQVARELGQYIYHGLLNVDVELERRFVYLQNRTRPPEHLTLRFTGSRRYLGVPYELMHDGHGPLAIRHPLCRQITGLQPASRQPFHALVEGLEGPLRILLLTSSTSHVTADEEAAALEEVIYRSASRTDLEVDVEIVGGNDLDAVRGKLAACPYHVVHYAGQIFQDRQQPANSGLLFAGEREDLFGQTVLPLPELVHLLEGSATRLFYLSANVQSPARAAYALHDSDPFDVLAGLAQAGMPYVVGFRWHVSDSGRHNLAYYFYENLLRAPFAPERAMCAARAAVHPDDESWASPVLVAQHVTI